MTGKVDRDLARRARAVLVTFGILVCPANAFAHDLMGEAGLQAGLMHPLSGVDHLLAMIAVGMVSVVLGGAAVWRVPATFLLAMLVGAAGGYEASSVPNVEFGVALSVLLLGLALVLPSLRGWSRVVYGSVAVFGLCHGHAHGLELPEAVAPVQFSFGFLLTSLFLHICGLFGAEVLSDASWGIRLRQSFGLMMAVIGAWLIGTKLST